MLQNPNYIGHMISKYHISSFDNLRVTMYLPIASSKKKRQIYFYFCRRVVSASCFGGEVLISRQIEEVKKNCSKIP